MLRGARDIPGLAADLFSSERYNGIGHACRRGNARKRAGQIGARHKGSERKNNGEAGSEGERRAFRLARGKADSVFPRGRKDGQGDKRSGARKGRRADQHRAGEA